MVNNYRKRGRNKSKAGIELKWRRRNKESRSWIKVRKAVLYRRVEGGGGVVRRSSRGSTVERRWEMEPPFQRGRGGQRLGPFKGL